MIDKYVPIIIFAFLLVYFVKMIQDDAVKGVFIILEMDKSFIEKTIVINAPVADVWSVFTNPTVTRQIGGEYVSDWKIGNDLGWKGIDGKMITRGSILQFEPGQILQHDLYSPATEDLVLSIITYRLEDNDQFTILHAREDLFYTMDKEYQDAANEGWDMALKLVKQVAEKL